MPEDVLARYMGRTLTPENRVEFFIDREPQLGWLRPLMTDYPGCQVVLSGETLRDILLGRFPRHFAVTIADIGSDVLRAWLSRRGDVRREGENMTAFTPRPLMTDVYIGDAPVHRRDFTFDHTTYDLRSKQFSDPHGGLDDLHNKTLRVAGYPLRAFAQDPLRTLRALRTAAQHKLAIDPETWHALTCSLPRLNRTMRTPEGMRYAVPRQHIGSTILDILEADPRYGHALLDASGALHLLFARHDDDRTALDASGLLLHQLHQLHASRTTGLPRLDPTLILATVFSPLSDAHHHAREQVKRWRIGVNTDDLGWLLENLNLLADVDPASMSPSAFEKTFASPRGRALLALLQARYLADGTHHLARARLHTARRLLSDLDARRQNLPKLIRGRDLEALGLAPGPTYRSVLAQIRDAQLAGSIHTRDQALALASKLCAS